MFEYFFNRIYCINLASRTDRWKDMHQQFIKLSVIPEKIPGIKGNEYNLKPDKYPHPMRAFNGVAGGTMAHLNTYIEAYSMKLNSFLVTEDDCVFHESFKDLFQKYIIEVPDDWDLLYLGGLFEPSKGQIIKRVSDNIIQMNGIMSTHCYGVKHTVLLRLISTFLRDYPYLTDSADGFLCQVQKECNTYAFYPPLVWQKAGFSDVQNEYRDYEQWFKQLIR